MKIGASREVSVALSILALISYLAATSASAEDSRKYLIDPATTTINGIGIDTEESEIIKLIGTPKAIELGYSEVKNKSSKLLYYDGMTIYFITGTIHNLSCTGKRCETDRGVKIGDSKEKVLEVYGPGNTPYQGAIYDSLSYPLKGIDSSLVFEFRDGKIFEIEFFVDYV